MLSPEVVVGWSSFSADDVASMRAAGVRHILPTPGASVRYDEVPGVSKGARLQVEHLYERGHRRIAVATSEAPHLPDLERTRVAAAVAGAAIRDGIRIPADLAVIGHDDSLIASLFVPSLSSVRMDTAEAGRYLAALALQVAEGRP